jgi:hypothetical protein
MHESNGKRLLAVMEGSARYRRAAIFAECSSLPNVCALERCQNGSRFNLEKLAKVRSEETPRSSRTVAYVQLRRYISGIIDY